MGERTRPTIKQIRYASQRNFHAESCRLKLLSAALWKIDLIIFCSREESGNNDVHYMHLDLASLQSVREFAEEVCNLFSKKVDFFLKHPSIQYIPVKMRYVARITLLVDNMTSI